MSRKMLADSGVIQITSESLTTRLNALMATHMGCHTCTDSLLKRPEVRPFTSLPALRVMAMAVPRLIKVSPMARTQQLKQGATREGLLDRCKE